MVRGQKPTGINIKTHGCTLDLNCLATDKHTIFSPVSILSKHNLLLQHSEITEHILAMQEPATALWGLSISDADFEKLKAGLVPRDMDDKWRVLVTNQDGDSNISVTFYRGWTDKAYYILVMKPSDSGSSNSDVKIESITWEQRKGKPQRSEDQAKEEVVILARCNLGCKFDALPKYIPRM